MNEIAVEPEVVELDHNKLLGFREIAAFGVDAAALVKALDDIHNKIGEIPS